MVDTSANRPAELTLGVARASRLLKQGDGKSAVAYVQTLLRDHPDDSAVLRCLALGYLQQQQLIEAERYLIRALHIAPDSPDLLSDLGVVRLKQRAFDEAVCLLTRALQIDPAHSDALRNLAATFSALRQPRRAKVCLDRLACILPFAADVYVRSCKNSLALDEVEQAVRYGRKAVRLAPDSSAARLSLAEALETRGAFQQAKYQYLSILTRDPDHAIALSKLLSLREVNAAQPYESQAQQLLNGAKLKESDRVRLHLGLARYYDEGRNYQAAFEHLHAGNSIRFRNHMFDSATFSQSVDDVIKAFTPQFMQSLPSHGSRSTRPIFIVGMPRSGTTLVEQILASHSKVQAGGELSTVENIVSQLNQAGMAYPAQIQKLDAGSLGRLAKQYLDRLEAISRDAPRVTDKMPFNFMHLGLIVAMFPNSKIIHCQRDARDTCLSCYFTTFSEHLQFASSLETLGKYYLNYRRLMTHWRTVLPMSFLDVQYEKLVVNTEKEISELLRFCDLDWESGCMNFHQSERSIRTPSRWQVRKPIYRHSMGRWRHYESSLQPLVEILSPVLRQ